jgi:hypothetical protein
MKTDTIGSMVDTEKLFRALRTVRLAHPELRCGQIIPMRPVLHRGRRSCRRDPRVG